MHNDNATELQKENNLLNRQLKVMRELDVIRDQLDEKDLRELLLECLKFLAHELNAMARFGAVLAL